MGKKLSRAEKKAENERAIAEMEDAMREAGTPLGNVGKATPALSKDKTEGAGESRAQKTVLNNRVVRHKNPVRPHFAE